MARRSKRQSQKAVSALLALTVVGLVIAGVVKIRHDYFLTGTELIGWAFVPLALLLGFTLPVMCRVERTNRKACGNNAYGLLFGCTKVAGHWTGKFGARLRIHRGEAKPVARRRSSGSTVLLNQPVPQSKPIKVEVEEGVLAKCGFWVGLVSGIVGLAQAIFSLVH